MATRKPPTASTEELAQAVAQALALDDDTINGEALSPALDALYAELGMTEGSDATVHVSKIDSDGRGNEAQVWRGDPDQYDLEMIAKKFGSGAYRVKVYVRIPSGQKVVKGNKVFHWLLSPEDEAKRQITQTPVIAPPIDMRAEMGRMINDTLQSLLPKIMPAPQAQPDPMAMMAGLADIMARMMPVRSEVAPAPQVNTLGMMRDMVELMNLMRGEQEPIERGSNATFNDLMLSALNKFGPLLQGALTQPGTSAPQIPMGPHASPGHTVATSSPHPISQQVPQQSQEDDVSLKLKMGLMFLVQQCEAGGAPETYAEVVIDSVPPDELQKLMAQPNVVDILAQFAPDVKKHEQWFVSLMNEIREMLSDAPENTTGGAA